jgi:hypothetical protein
MMKEEIPLHGILPLLQQWQWTSAACTIPNPAPSLKPISYINGRFFLCDINRMEWGLEEHHWHFDDVVLVESSEEKVDPMQ